MDLISRLKRDKRFFATCPSCGEDFRLADAALFPVRGPLPSEAVAVIEARNEVLREAREDLKARKHKMTVRAEITAESVNLGKIVEKIAPSFPTFAYPAPDCRALFEPIDYVVFNGLTKAGSVNSIRFVDVKSGQARLTKKQKQIKAAIDAGRVELVTVSGNAR